MPQNAFSILELLDLSPLERDIVLVISRAGPADADGLSRQLDRSLADIQSALAALEQQQRLFRLPNGQVDILFGHVRRHTTLPEQIWPALLSAERVYNQQEIAILQTAFPMLQFARLRLSNYADHGPAHALRVKLFATQLGYLLDLNRLEHNILRSAALFHDIGNIVERGNHHIISQETVIKLTALGRLPFSSAEAELVGLVCRWHRRDYEPGRVDYLDGLRIRTGLLASILRVADAMDIDHRRSDYDQCLRAALEFFFPEQTLYFTSLEEIAGVRLHTAPEVALPPLISLQVFTHVPTSDNIQIEGLKKDIATTPLGWPVTLSTVCQGSGSGNHGDQQADQRALLVFPFEPHSLIMAAISQMHLEEAGCQVQMLCYPDTERGPAWLWRNALPAAANAAASLERFQHLVVIGDRPDSAVLPELLQTVCEWQGLGARVSVLNRHEANWARLPQLLQAGVEIILGGDWVYYWGDHTTAADITWSRIAALCNHDPTFSTIGVTDEEVAVMRGLLHAVYTTALLPADSSAAVLALAQPIIHRIIADDRGHFASQAGDFFTKFATPNRPGQVNGRLVYFDGPPGASPYKCQWALETAIEQLGRGNVRGVHFNTPYAVATWQDGDAVELVAINHWREEDAIPIRLLYPKSIGPEPHGLESIVHVRLLPEEARAVLKSLMEACNQ